jgi:hypothetical protein
MIHHPPVKLQSSVSCLLALSEGIVSFGIEQSGQWIDGVWICTDSQAFLITSVSVDRAWKFEVFPLSVQTPADAFAAAQEGYLTLASGSPPALFPVAAPKIENFRVPSNLPSWPFQKWKVDVLERLDWLSNPEGWPDGYNIPSNLHPGELPLGTEHSCWVAPGLLFISDQDNRLLVATDDFPCTLKVSTEPDVIDDYLGPCRTIPLVEYVAHLTV